MRLIARATHAYVRYINQANDYDGDTTKYSQYTVPGGKNYKELLLTLPFKNNAPSYESWKDHQLFLDENNDISKTKYENEVGYYNKRGTYAKENTFKSSHFEQPNILAHVRFDERTDDNGNKVLFIHEIQSDWGQKGKKDGFANESERKKVSEDIERIHNFKVDRFTSTQKLEDAGVNPKLVNAWDNAFMKGGDIPTAPFVTDTKAWGALAIKRMARYAVDNGFNKVAFANGEQSINASTNNNPTKEQLHGSKVFYDQIVPQVTNDVLKKVGGEKVENLSIGEDTYHTA